MQFTENFHQALQDYTFLLDKKYPEKTVLEMVATRYSLNHFERSMLYRGITSKENAERRKIKLITIEELNNGTLHIDLFNVLFTLAAYLRGFPVFLSNDGLLRDASESHGSGDWEVHLDKGLDLLMECLEDLEIQKTVMYIDNPLEYGLAIAEKLRELAKDTGQSVKVVTDPSPDHLIRAVTEGIIPTSDSTIIDKTKLPVLDLPVHILHQSFHREIISLEEYLESTDFNQ
jgi:hypothetical protein